MASEPNFQNKKQTVIQIVNKQEVKKKMERKKTAAGKFLNLGEFGSHTQIK